MRRLFSMLVLIAMGSAWADVASAEDTLAPADLPLTTLVERAEAALAAGDAIEEKRAELRQKLDTVANDLQAQGIERQAFEVPEPPGMETTPTEPDAVQTLIADWERRTTALESLMTLTQNWRSLAAQHRETALLLAQETELLLGSQDQAQAIFSELSARIEAETITQDNLPDALQATPDWPSADELATEVGQWRGAANRDQVLVREADAALKDLEEALANASRGTETATGWLADVTARANLRSDYESRDPADLSSQFSLLRTETDTKTEEMRDRLANLEQKSNELAEARAAFEALESPTLDEITLPTETRIESLRRAQANAILAERTLAFRRNRLDALTAIESQVGDLQTAYTDTIDAANALLTDRVELEVMAEVLATSEETDTTGSVPTLDDQLYPVAGEEEQPPAPLSSDSADPQDFAAGRSEVAGWIEQLEERAAALDQAAAELAETKTTITEAITDAQAKVEETTRVAQRESRWASFITAVESLGPEDLRQAFEDAVREVGMTKGFLEEVEIETAAQAQAVRAAEDALTADRDPVMLTRSSDAEAFQEWRAAEGLLLAEANADGAADDGEAEGTEAGGAADGQASEAAPTPPPSSEQAPSRVNGWLGQTRTFRDQVVSRRLTYYQEHIELGDDVAGALARYKQQLEGEIGATEAALEAARRAWGSASTLKARMAQGEVEVSQRIAEEIERWLDRQPVIALQDRLTRLQTEMETVSKRLQAAQADPFEAQIATPLIAWSDNLTRTIEFFGDYLTLRDQYQAIESIDELDELERRLLEREIAQRIEADQGVFGALGDFFGSQQTGTIDELLHRYYSRLVVLERRVENLARRNATMADVIEAAEAQRAILEPLLTFVKTAAAEATATLQERTVLVKAALFPAQAPTLFTEYEEATGNTIDPAQVPKLETEGTEEELLAAREGLIQSLLTDWAREAGYREWGRQLEQRIAPLGGIETRIADYKDLQAGLDATRQELQRTVVRLAGHEPEELESLLATGDPLGPDERRRFELGEIGLLQMERRELLTWRAVESAISLVVIPIIAFILIIAVRGFGKRMVARATRAEGPEDQPLSAVKRQEREERAKTLSGIFQKVSTGLIIILAAIYMLQVINIDVTPIIASLGVLGLAVAFGAQAITRDVFSGFFLLLENQINKGDWVTINGQLGQVENIGLKTTTIRQWPWGSLNYFPNGSIGYVENWSREYWRRLLEYHVPFEYDAGRVLEVLNAAIKELMSNPELANLVKEIYAYGIFKTDYATGSYVYCVGIEMWGMKGKAFQEYQIIAQRLFKEAGIPLGVPIKHEVRSLLPGKPTHPSEIPDAVIEEGPAPGMAPSS